MPKWNPRSLTIHFKKRVIRDAACLKDVFGRPVALIKESDYALESMKVLSTAWICYSGQKLDRRGDGWGGVAYYDQADHFVDDRLLTTIVSRSTDTVLTCYHEDFDLSHKPSPNKIEQMVKYVERLGNERRGNVLRNFSVKSFVPPASYAAALNAELARVRAVPEKSVSTT